MNGVTWWKEGCVAPQSKMYMRLVAAIANIFYETCEKTVLKDV